MRMWTRSRLYIYSALSLSFSLSLSLVFCSVPCPAGRLDPNSHLKLNTQKTAVPKLRIDVTRNGKYDDAGRRTVWRKGTTGCIVERQGGTCVAQEPVEYRLLWLDVYHVPGGTRPGEFRKQSSWSWEFGSHTVPVVTDDRCDCTSDDRGQAWWWEQL